MRPSLYLLLASLLLPPSLGQAVPLSFGMRKLAFSANQFGIDLYRTMRHSEGNIAVCPFCIDQSLLMTLLGAQGQSAMALRHVLYLWGMQVCTSIHLFSGWTHLPPYTILDSLNWVNFFRRPDRPSKRRHKDTYRRGDTWEADPSKMISFILICYVSKKILAPGTAHSIAPADYPSGEPP